MSTPALETLAALCSQPEGPPVIQAEALSAEEVRQLTALLTARGVEARVIDGGKLAGKPDLLRAIADAFGFPAYFGHNWDALIDCWSDLSWLPARGYVCVLLRADALRAADAATHETLLEVCADVAQRWQEGEEGRVFKLVRCAGS